MMLGRSCMRGEAGWLNFDEMEAKVNWLCSCLMLSLEDSGLGCADPQVKSQI